MRHHNLNSDIRFFTLLKDEVMTADIRFNDRDFQAGDYATHHEGQLNNGTFEKTGRTTTAIISHVQSELLTDNKVCLSFKNRGISIADDLAIELFGKE